MNNAIATTQNNEAQFIMIGDTRIEMKDGAYCLNDLHKASGAPSSKKPSKWLANNSTQEFLTEARIRASVVKGNVSGIFAPKAAVYSYAMWISPLFQIKVIDVFDAYVTGKLEQPPSTGNAMLDAVIESQRQLNEVKVQVDKQQLKIEDLESRNYIMNECPANMAGITAIKVLINKRHGLPKLVIQHVMHEMPYSPKPAGQVKMTHEDANGGNYTVWYKVEVTKLFARFVSECTMETKTKATHPSFEDRFKLIIKETK